MPPFVTADGTPIEENIRIASEAITSLLYKRLRQRDATRTLSSAKAQRIQQESNHQDE
ncbi:hypothetical protein [Calothrix sp. PCC 7507]|uniref:hypothetical protein n=1 Tax=Calothrix sp. PCC 7507 TaxID=99598 RepID=UPI00029F04D7|nr:hypothetical protein [Calothrix sp. PCC 7507]AFY30586.1 hypothetical protein Cal7507_0074 [Calothrix sp. PCC 7507]